MNERMKIKIEREIWPQCISDFTKDTGEVMKNYFDKYKFAELIVQECAAHLNFVGDEYAGIELLEHFGVEG